MADRTAFLASIRARIAAHEGQPRPQYQPTRAPDSPWTPRQPLAPPAAPPDDLAARFAAALRALGGHAERLATLEAARAYLLELAATRQAHSVVRWDDPVLDALGADELLREQGIAVAICRDTADAHGIAAQADIGLSTAAYAIAETGSLVLESGSGWARAVTLLPPIYVAVVPIARLVPSVADLLLRYAGQATLPASLALHTGPSRSADIEQSLAIGVHGPGDVHALVVG